MYVWTKIPALPLRRNHCRTGINFIFNDPKYVIILFVAIVSIFNPIIALVVLFLCIICFSGKTATVTLTLPTQICKISFIRRLKCFAYSCSTSIFNHIEVFQRLWKKNQWWSNQSITCFLSIYLIHNLFPPSA